jgi:P27 family predicted phage terminase small subunit
MGLSGPIPISDYQRKAHGETRPSEQKDSKRTSAKVEAPNCPAWLKGHALTCWKHIVPLLTEQGTIAKCDRNALIRYCITYAKWREVALEFMVESPTQTDKDKVARKSPLFQIYRDLGGMLAQLEGEFGMTPKARMRVTPVGANNDEPDPDDLD